MDVRVEDSNNRLVTPSRAQKAPPCTLVIFGAGGDLTKRLLMTILVAEMTAVREFRIAVTAPNRSKISWPRGHQELCLRRTSGPPTASFDARAWEFIASRRQLVTLTKPTL
jgi:glucose-6-phosphate 1-dehydrogenase